MALSQDLNLQLRQKLSLSREMLLSLELIQLPLLDLCEKIENEILENPALEINEKKKSDDQDIDNLENSFYEDNNYFSDSSSAEISTGVSPTSSDIDLKRQFLEGVISYKETLKDHLLWQLYCQNLTDQQKDIGQTIISLIDDDGFFKQKLDEIFSAEEFEVAEDVLTVIQLFDPPGIAASGMQEALLFQIESLQQKNINQNAYVILKDYFDLLINRKDNEIAKKMKITLKEVKEAIEFLGQFNPYPGREFTSEEIKYIVPDAYVFKRENSLVVEMNEDILPSLTINKYIEKIAKQASAKKKMDEHQKYAIKKMQTANQFISLVNYRNSSLFKLILMLVKFQEDFFFKGPKFLKPLTMKLIAQEIGLSESTISRLSSSKYIQTEWGIHEIKYFFTNSIGKSDNQNNKDQSAESVREMIKEILENNKENTKISDQKIAEILQNKGIKIARRTVAKYRKILNILPSHQRNL